MKNIHILPTDKPSEFYSINGKHKLANSTMAMDWYISSAGYKPHNIYITSDVEISGLENNIWVYNNGRVWLWQNTMALVSNNKPRKIILTTDQDLIKDGVQAIDDEFLEWLVKNPTCEEVEIYLVELCDNCGQQYCDNSNCRGCKDEKFYLISTSENTTERVITYCDGYKVKEEPKQIYYNTVGRENGEFAIKGQFNTQKEALDLANELNRKFPELYYDWNETLVKEEPKQENNFFESLQKYFKDTPKEKVLEDWAKSAEFDNVSSGGESIEEAAEQFDKSKCKHFRREHTKEEVYDSFEEGFTAGAKSDAARNYWFEEFQNKLL
jgi:hypothetical protein